MKILSQWYAVALFRRTMPKTCPLLISMCCNDWLLWWIDDCMLLCSWRYFYLLDQQEIPTDHIFDARFWRVTQSRTFCWHQSICNDKKFIWNGINFSCVRTYTDYKPKKVSRLAERFKKCKTKAFSITPWYHSRSFKQKTTSVCYRTCHLWATTTTLQYYGMRVQSYILDKV
jgi:hypothetical protein